MTITDRDRHDLFELLEANLGGRGAEIMMELLPHQGWTDIARKSDIHALDRAINDRITAEIANLRAEVRTEFANVRTEFHSEITKLRAELHSEIGDVRTEMGDIRAEIGDLRTDMATFKGEIRHEITVAFAAHSEQFHQDLQAMQRNLIIAMAVTIVTMIITVALG